MDSAIADVGSPSISEQSGEDNAFITTFSFDDLAQEMSQEDHDLFAHLLQDNVTVTAEDGVVSLTDNGQRDLSADLMKDITVDPVMVDTVRDEPVVVETAQQKRRIVKVVVPKQEKKPYTKRGKVADKFGPEEDEDAVEKNRKNAINARLNRERKKAYMSELESKVSTLARENEVLKKDSRKLAKERHDLAEEVEYLRNIIANQSTLSGLIQNIGNIQNVRLTSSFAQRQRSTELDHDYGELPSSKRRKLNGNVSGGVCLHVDNNDVSLEFCHHCAKLAKAVQSNAS